MGYKIKTYTLTELKKIRTPGKVVPALFWLIPIGDWNGNELNNLWSHFTKNKSSCKEVGLMLVNEGFNDYKDPKLTSNLTELTGKLSDILPSGTSSIYGEEFQPKKKHKNQVLILSGLYPYPGWGVHISLENDFTEKLEKIVKNAMEPSLNVIFSEATTSYDKWNDLKKVEPTIKGDIERLKEKKEYCIELYEILKSILGEYNKEHINDFYFQVLKQKYDAARDKSTEEYIDLLNPLFEIVDDKFILSLMILKCLKDISEGEINSTLIRFISEHHPKTNNLFISEKNEQIKKIAGKLFKLREDNKPTENFIFWAKSIFESKIDKIGEIIKTLTERFENIIGNLEIKINNHESIYNSELKEWKEKLETSRIIFKKNLQAVLESHSKYGPGFLLDIENQTKKLGLDSKSFSWDPARMIGWKIVSAGDLAGVKIETEDIIQRLRDIIPEFSQENNDLNYKESFNGSLFTDFVHYISLKDPRLSPRKATKELLEKTLLSSQINKILQKEDDNKFKIKEHNEKVETLLVEFGWPADKIINKNKLADCLIENKGNTIINPSFSGNDIRIICENYCKDLIDTLSSLLPYSAIELFNLVTRKKTNYESQNRGWDYEISNLSLGRASIILEVLLSEALPSKEEISKVFIKNFNSFVKKMNDLSHDPPIGETSDLINGIVALFEYTKELISEMPWHFYPVQRNGIQPIVLTGTAWSHSYKESRQLSIILWTNDNSESLLVWNPSKVNPVVPDGQIINRPQQ